ncbi:protein of unknown function [Cupriavidus taiwanensis]|nr:protein of unknown function [Cupriavidus taiwanensis]SPD39536.1 protein of unknown function [Cupriavidus taiwanensis]
MESSIPEKPPHPKAGRMRALPRPGPLYRTLQRRLGSGLALLARRPMSCLLQPFSPTPVPAARCLP